MSSVHRPLRWPLVAAGVVVVLAIAAAVVTLRSMRPSTPNACTVATLTATPDADDHYRFDLDQAYNASTIAAVASRRDLPARAVTIALATAMQESKLHNLDYGDRDSLGLFQQRHSQGWGTPEEIMNPSYAAGKFYDALVKVKNWQTLTLTEAAQKVQRSGYPNAYARWEPRAQALADALTGATPATLACHDHPAPTGTTEAVTALVHTDLGLSAQPDPVAGTGTGAGNIAMLRVAASTAQQSWSVAAWAVAHASDMGIRNVQVADQEWSISRGTWRTVTPDGVGSNDVLIEVVGAT